MKYSLLKIWLMVTIALALGATIIRLVWEVTVNPSAGTLSVVIPIILAILGSYAFLAYLAIKPNLKKLKSLPVVIWVTVMTTAALIGGVIHFTRFILSPGADPTLSLIIAVLLLLATISACFLVLWVIWSSWKARGS